MGKAEPWRVTMMDVAHRAGVSYQTVSRVINDHPNVAVETRARVLAVISELNYRPNKAARSLATRKSQTLAMITYSMKYYGPTQMVINVEQCARESGYDLIFSNIDGLTGAGMDATIDSLFRWAVDGILLIAPVASSHYEYMVQQFRHTPLIQLDNVPGSPHPSVIIDQNAGSCAITRHLIELGHQQIACITGPMNWFGAAARHRGWLDALTEAGLTPAASTAGDWTAQGGYEAAGRLLDNHDFTALVVANDQMAVGVIRALSERGLCVPRDVSVVGFDDIPEAAYFSPPLTTIRQDFSALGRQGLQYLIQLIQDPTLSGQRVIQPQFVLRESTASPAKD